MVIQAPSSGSHSEMMAIFHGDRSLRIDRAKTGFQSDTERMVIMPYQKIDAPTDGDSFPDTALKSAVPRRAATTAMAVT